ncbi:calcium/sodium antiporter [Nodosilinea sp. LEGE 06152]|uniref:calcium/sodium antiporter n=1 Tax=Nodosilinea sp. LEGE 06152 TaxID=2777966 RepID=UPI00187DDF62|nr:calcium/sodium antiporter [Nodosilinea sp. LEGE 06152]MBE9159280.1 calcium/sodium antiporter [Nodosilinea sp. LEGE 06152]
MTVAILLLIAGGGLLLVGAETLVRGASKLAALLGISPLIIGLTIVAYGTSAPEMAVSVQSSLAGQGDIALGNVIGSNIFNVLVILGLSSLVSPLPVAQQLVRLDVPIMVGISGLLVLFSLDGRLQPSDGIIFLIGGVVYTLFLIYQSRRETNAEVQSEYDREYGAAPVGRWTWALNLAYIAVGLVTLVVGSRMFVTGAVSIAQALGVSQLVIGLTIVAAGTSLPELATSAVATFRGEGDIAVGNVIGSNIFNILTVLGVTALTSGAGVAIPDSVLHFDLPVMVAVAVACLPIFLTGNVISRWEGGLFVGYYVAYATYLILRAASHDGLGVFSRVMLLFVIPLTVITLLVVMIRSWPKKRRSPVEHE